MTDIKDISWPEPMANRLRVANDRIAELEQALETCKQRTDGLYAEQEEFYQENQRLRNALIPVPEEMSLSQIEAWLSRYEVKRKKALEES